MEGLVAWLKSLIFLVIFASFIELVLPQSTMNRFIRFIVGLFIMLAVLQPFITWFEKIRDPAAINVMAHSLQHLESENKPAQNFPNQKQQQLAKQLYEQELAQQIRAFVKQLEGVADAEVVVAASNEPKEQGKVEKVIIRLKEKSLIQPVDPVSIERKEKKEQSLSPAAEKAKRSVSEIYQLGPNQIEIYSL